MTIDASGFICLNAIMQILYKLYYYILYDCISFLQKFILKTYDSYFGKNYIIDENDPLSG